MNPVETKYHDLLRDSEHNLNTDIRAGLTRAREAALKAPGRQAKWYFNWLPVSGVAAAALVAIVLVWPEFQGGSEAVLKTDPRITENLEIYQNLDFYYWLDQQGFRNNG